MAENLEELNAVCEGCQKCRLGATRTNLVFGVGVENAEVMFIGEGPGENEDLQGEPFVGRGGKLLDKMLNAIDLDRHKNIYIGRYLKCYSGYSTDYEIRYHSASGGCLSMFLI